MRNLFRRWLRRNRRLVRILVIDDFAPDLRIGAGTPRLVELLRALSKTGASVTVYPIKELPVDQSDGVQISAHGATIIRDENGDLGAYLAKTRGFFEAIIVSRPHNMATFRLLVQKNPDIAGSAIVIYDAEALFSARDEIELKLRGTPIAVVEARRRRDEEVALAQNTQLVLAVNERTAAAFVAAGHPDVRVLGYAISAQTAWSSFETRDGFLFVGPAYSDSTPNADAILWFVENVVPLLRSALRRDVSLMLAGVIKSSKVQAHIGAGIEALGVVSDLKETYSRSRVFVAPIRFAAGIPLKVYQASAYGVPAVVSPLLADLLGWKHEQEVLVAETPEDVAAACLRLHSDRELWQRIRVGALKRVAKDCSTRRFDKTVATIVDDVAKRG